MSRWLVVMSMVTLIVADCDGGRPREWPALGMADRNHVLKGLVCESNYQITEEPAKSFISKLPPFLHYPMNIIIVDFQIQYRFCQLLHHSGLTLRRICFNFHNYIHRIGP